MIGTTLLEDLVQSVALSHRIAGHDRVSLLMLAAPESGKTTIATAATCAHVTRVALITGRSVLREISTHPETEFLLFNDLSSIRAMSHAAVSLLVVILNQVTQDERGIVAFAGRDVETIDRSIGMIGCLPFKTFCDHRARWRELGFVSRMIPFAYAYSGELTATIKDTIDAGTHRLAKQPLRKMPKARKHAIAVGMSSPITRAVRHLADTRAIELGQLGIRLLRSYHALIRAHALMHGRRAVITDDLVWLRAIDAHVSISTCRPLDPT
jgi:hypothetical protein